jgi:membrane-bound metal-dependent hydrolase YbcI (DUF457 family)
MMLGHGLLAFALVAGIAGKRLEPRRVLALGTVAAAFATVPDVDMLFTLPGLFEGATAIAAVGSGELASSDVFTVTSAFWAASTEVHRSVTHSLVVAVPASLAAGLLGARDPRLRRRLGTLAAGALLLAPVVAAIAVARPLVAALLALFAVAVAGVALAVRQLDFAAPTVVGLAAVGLGTHPFGDLFTGESPRLLYPLGLDPVPTRLALAADPTLHLLGAFALEIVAAWAALTVGLALYGQSPRSWVRPVAAGGLLYGPAGLVLTPPTLAASYQFVFSVLAVGLAVAGITWASTRPARPVAARTDGGRELAAAGNGSESSIEPERTATHPLRARGERLLASPEPVVTAVVTGTAAVTLAWLAYLGAYLSGLTPA